MEGQEQHNYRVVGDRYKGICGESEVFARVNTVIPANSKREADYLAFQQDIIPRKIKDLGKVVGETRRI